MHWKNIPVDLDLYDPAHDPEADHAETPNCNNDCGEKVSIDGDVCETCYNAE